MISVNNNLMEKGIFSILGKNSQEEKILDSDFFNIFSSLTIDQVNDKELTCDFNPDLSLSSLPFSLANNTIKNEINFDNNDKSEFHINDIDDEFESLDSLLIKISSDTPKIDQSKADELLSSINEQLIIKVNGGNNSNAVDQIISFAKVNAFQNSDYINNSKDTITFGIKEYETDTESESELLMKSIDTEKQVENHKSNDIKSEIKHIISSVINDKIDPYKNLDKSKIMDFTNSEFNDVSNNGINKKSSSIKLDAINNNDISEDNLKVYDLIKSVVKQELNLDDHFETDNKLKLNKKTKIVDIITNQNLNEQIFSEDSVIDVKNNNYKNGSNPGLTINHEDSKLKIEDINISKDINDKPIIDVKITPFNINKDVKTELIGIIKNIINQEFNISNNDSQNNTLKSKEKIKNTRQNDVQISFEKLDNILKSIPENEIKNLIHNFISDIYSDKGIDENLISNNNNPKNENPNLSVNIEKKNYEDIDLYNNQNSKTEHNTNNSKSEIEFEIINLIKNTLKKELNLRNDIVQNNINESKEIPKNLNKNDDKSSIKIIEKNILNLNKQESMTHKGFPLEFVQSISKITDKSSIKDKIKLDSNLDETINKFDKIQEKKSDTNFDPMNSSKGLNVDNSIVISELDNINNEVINKNVESKNELEITNTTEKIVTNHNSGLNGDNNYSQSNNNSQKKQNEQNRTFENLGNINQHPNNFINKPEPINSNPNTSNSLNYISKLEELSSKISLIASKNIDGETTTARINLSPKSLGTLVVEITQKKDDLKIVINAESKDVANLIEQNIGGLKEKLINQGINSQNMELNINVQTQTATLMNKGENKEDKGSAKQDKKQNKYTKSSEILGDIDQSTINYKKYDSGKFIEKYI